MLIGYVDQVADPRSIDDKDDVRLTHWDGGYLPGLRRLADTDDMGTPSWLRAHLAYAETTAKVGGHAGTKGNAQQPTVNNVSSGLEELTEDADRLMSEGFLNWNGYRGETNWLGRRRVRGGAKAASNNEGGGMGGGGHGGGGGDGVAALTGLTGEAAYAKEASDTFVLVNRAMGYISEQVDARKERVEAQERIQGDGGGGEEGAPWAMHLSLLKPHPPWTAPSPYNDMYLGGDENTDGGGGKGSGGERVGPAAYPKPVRVGSVAEEGALHPWLAMLHAQDGKKALYGSSGTAKDVSDVQLLALKSQYVCSVCLEGWLCEIV